MFSRMRLALAGLLAIALCAVVLLVPASASAAVYHCSINAGGAGCGTVWNNWTAFYVTNYSGSSLIWCDSWHSDGSHAGEYGTVQPGATRYFWAAGYNKMVCRYYSGPSPIPTDIAAG